MWAHQVRSYVRYVNPDDTTHPPASAAPTADPDVPRYEIRVAGRLGARWAAWFDGLTLTVDQDGTTALRGPVVDQAALHGLLQKLRDLGVPLVALTRLDDPATHQLSPQPTATDNSGATT